MTLLEPYWLFLAFPLAAALLLWPPPSRLQRILRIATLSLVLLTLAGLTLRLPSRAGTIVVVADRSASMPGDSEVKQKEIIDLIQKQMGASDQLAVVSFGQGVGVDRTPTVGSFSHFQREVGRDASELSLGLEKALELLPEGTPGRILVLSDGRWTGRNPLMVAVRAAAREVAIDYRVLERTRAGDVAIERIDAPSGVAVGESFLITAWVQSPTPQEVAFKLHDRDRVIASGKQRLISGRNRLSFRDRARQGGNHSYSLVLTGMKDDPVPGNDQAKLVIGITGPRPILHVTRSPNSGLAALLRKGGLDVREAAPASCKWTLEDLSRYSAVILENVPADLITHSGMELIASWVKETGAGLMMTGGRESYGPGGYHKSPIDAILPLSMELRNEHRKHSVAIVVVLDRSGSMAMPVSGGQVKMDLANAGAAAVLDLLGPNDEFGCLAVDTKPHIIADLASVTIKGRAQSKIRSIKSQGGGIYVHAALSAAAKMIAPAKAGTKHIILFSDAQDSEEPGDYQELLGHITRAGITVSVIGLGKASDTDGALLMDIGKLGNGRCFFTDRAEELPRLFAQDTFVVARNTFLDDPTRVRETAGLALLTGRPLGFDLTLGGYNLCYLRPDASLGGVTLDEYRAPVVASWQAGTGRVLCYTGEADGKYAGEMPGWRNAGEFYTSLARWIAGQHTPLPDHMLLKQEVRDGIAVVELHLDPDRKKEPFTGLPRAKVLRGEQGKVPRSELLTLRWSGPDLLTAEVPLQGTETALTTVEVPGQKPVTLSAVCQLYSPELKPEGTESGATTLEKLTRATGGRERVDLSGIWLELPRRPRLIAVAPWLLSLAVLLVLAEVFERRTGMLSQRGWFAATTKEDRVSPERMARLRPAPARPTVGAPAVESPLAATPEPVAKPVVESEQNGLMDALRKAKERTRARLD